MEVSLMEILDARERRVKRQEALLAQYGKPLLCFTMNIAGPVKNSPLIRRGFALGKTLLERQLPVQQGKILHVEQVCGHTGNEAMYVLDCDVLHAKRAAALVEDHTPAGRLFDMDVIRPDGSKVSREELGLGERTCLLCGKPARICARSRAHSVQQLQQRTEEMLKDALLRWESGEIARIACQAMLYEVAVTPKPGLVDRENSGSHRDMDFFSFQASGAALWPYFEECTKIGIETSALSPEQTFEALRGPGLLAEGAMLHATGGVNTHKGAIFSLGILCGAAGRLGSRDPEALLAECGRMAAGLVAGDFAGLTETSARTVGQRLYLHHGITGVRGQAEAGFPAVLQAGLPKLEAGLAQGLSMNDALCGALLALLTAAVDTNLIARSDYDTQQRVRRQVEELLRSEPFPGPERLRQLDAEFTAQNLSPGGSADLLAMTCFLYLLKQEQDIYGSIL